MKGTLKVFGNPGDLVRDAAGRIVHVLDEEILLSGRATLVLAGGNTPGALYELLGSEEYRNRIAWSRVHVFWGDERCVGPSMPQSNYRMAHETLLKNIPIAPENVHRIQGERPPQEAALAYEAEIRRLFPRRSAGPPEFTLVLLGLGEDGHTASLFPGTAVLHERNRLVMEVYVDSLRSSRITLTLPVINNAQHVMFLVAGRMKAPIVREVMEDDIPRHPAQLVNPGSGSLLWLVDRDAASLLAAELKSPPEKSTP